MTDPPRLGIPDDEFEQRTPKRGLITKWEVRVVSLARMNIKPDGVVWDIGTGSGSVSIEAARLAPRGSVWTIEKNAEDYEIAGRNCERFGVANVHRFRGRAPDGLSDWPDPDAVFIGGSGGELAEILCIGANKLRPGGRVVVNAATVETLSRSMAGLKELGFDVEVTMLQVSRSKPILDMVRFESLDPVFVICGRRAAVPPEEATQE